MTSFNKLANLHDMFFKRASDFAINKPVPPSPPSSFNAGGGSPADLAAAAKPIYMRNPVKPGPAVNDGWGSLSSSQVGTVTGRGYDERSYNAPQNRIGRAKVNEFGVHPSFFKDENSSMSKWLPRQYIPTDASQPSRLTSSIRQA